MDDPSSVSPSSAPAAGKRSASAAMRAGWVVSGTIHVVLIAVLAVAQPTFQSTPDFRFAAGAGAGEMVITLVEETPASRQQARKPVEAEPELHLVEALPGAPRVESPVAIGAAPTFVLPPMPAASPDRRQALAVAAPMASSTAPVVSVRPHLQSPIVTAPVFAGPAIKETTVASMKPRRLFRPLRVQTSAESPSAASSASPGIEAGALGITLPPPAYPRLSRLRGEEGVVVVLFDLPPSGAPTNIRVVRSPGFERLSRAAVAAVQQARLPAPPDGQTLTLRKEFHFRLR